MNVMQWDSEQDGPLSEAAMRLKLERMGYSVSRYSYAPGTYFSPHTHGVDKIDGVLAGRFRMGMQEGTVILEAGDMLEVPRGVLHSAEVVGDEAVISLDAVRK
jgi:quercetin dioxygenase-like cupin family protein